MVSSHRLAHLAKVLAQRTGSNAAVEAALKSADLTEDDLEKENHKIEGQNEVQFLQTAVTILEDTSFAAASGLLFTKNTGIPAYIARYSKDLRGAIESARKYTFLIDGNFSYNLITSSNSSSIVMQSVEPHLAFGDRLREFLVFGILATMRVATGREFFPLEIRFEHVAPNEKNAIQRMAGCSVEFSAEETEIILAPSTLNLSIPTYDPNLLRYLKGYGDSLLDQLDRPDPSLRARIERLLVENLPGRMLLAPEVAASLGMGQRTFTRRLASKGLSFSTIVEELRGKLAKTYLSQSETPITEIAFTRLLGPGLFYDRFQALDRGHAEGVS